MPNRALMRLRWYRRHKCRREFRKLMNTPRPFAMTDHQVEWFREAKADHWDVGEGWFP